MAPLPKRRHSSARQAQRTRALKVASVTLTKCPHCQELRVPHRVCPACGYYDGKPVILKKAHDHKHDHKVDSKI